MSARKRKAGDDFDERSYDEALSTSPTAERHIARPSKKFRNNEQVSDRPLALPRLLETLDADSLRSVLQAICEKHPQINQEVVTTAPRPSIASAFGVIEKYQQRLQNAFPYGGGDGDYAYNRVRDQLVQLIDAITDFVPHYLPPKETQTTISLEFLDGVTNIIHQLPDWESVGYRYHKDNAYEDLSKAWALVISEASKRGGGFQLHNGGWDKKVQMHNQRSGGRMQAAANSLGSNLGWIGAGASTSNSNQIQNPADDQNSIRNQMRNGTWGTDIPVGPSRW